MPRRLFLAAALLMLAALPLAAQPSQAPQPIISPEIHPDRSVTFRFRAPNAREVFLSREGTQRVPMKKDETGLWSITTEPLEPDLYGYAFVADGVALIDPSNSRMKPNLLNTQSVVHVPGPPDLPWEINNVPRGMLHRHFYRSAVVGDDRDLFVYTPPGYQSSGKVLYPALYLLLPFIQELLGDFSVNPGLSQHIYLQLHHRVKSGPGPTFRMMRQH